MMKLTLALATVGTAALIATNSLYPAAMEITEISGDVVTMETATGYTYTMTGSEDYMEGDLVSLIMFDNGTEVITDDIIVSARYSGYWFER